LNEPFNKENNCTSWANNSIYNIEEKNEGKNLLTQLNSEYFTITELELWKVIGDLPQGLFGEQSDFNI
jgi:hypothetical protein